MTRPLTVSDEAYRQLTLVKRDEESYSKTILRLIHDQRAAGVEAFLDMDHAPHKDAAGWKRQVRDERADRDHAGR